MPNIPDPAQLVLLGDFNVNYSESKGGEKRKLARVVALHNLEQFITEPTRITARSSTLLDFLFCNTSQRVVDHGIIHLASSDHSLVYCVLKAGVTKAPPRTIECQSYKSFNTNAFNQDLASVPWHVVENENNIDDAVLTWNKLFSEIADAHAPFKKRRVKGVPVPWVSEITRFFQQRN